MLHGLAAALVRAWMRRTSQSRVPFDRSLPDSVTARIKIEINANLFARSRDIFRELPGLSWLQCNITVFDSWTFDAYDMLIFPEQLKMVNKHKKLAYSA
jgi:hypothetical protein